MNDLLKVLIERSGCPSFHLQTCPSDIRTQSSSESVPGNRDIQMTCTVAQPSLTKELEQNIIDSLPNEIDVTNDEDTNEVNSKEKLKIKSKKVNSIVLEINATCGILQSPSKLRSAICDLVDMVLDKGEVDKNAKDSILVTLSFESPLMKEEKVTVIDLFETKDKHDNEGNNDKPSKKTVELMAEENQTTTHSTDVGEMIHNKAEAKKICKDCKQRDIHINKLEKNNTKLNQRIWTLQRYLNQQDPETAEELSDEDSDYMSNQTSEGTMEENIEFTSGSKSYQTSVTNNETIHQRTEAMKNELYARLSLAVVRVLPCIFRSIIKSVMSPALLSSLCKLPFNTFTYQQQTTLKKVQITNSYDPLDIPVIYRIIRLFSLLRPPTRGWGILPNSTDVSIGDDIERMRLLRNRIVHIQIDDISETVFDNYFTQFLSIGERIDKYLNTSYKQEILSCMTLKLSSNLQVKYAEGIKELEQKQRFEAKPIKFFWGNSYDSSLRNLLSTIDELKMTGIKKSRLQIIFTGEHDLEQTTKIMRVFGKDKKELFEEIDFVYAFK